MGHDGNAVMRGDRGQGVGAGLPGRSDRIVEALRSDAVDLAHAGRQRRPQGFDRRVVVVAHQAP